jgi:hypothetical protein
MNEDWNEKEFGKTRHESNLSCTHFGGFSPPPVLSAYRNLSAQTRNASFPIYYQQARPREYKAGMVVLLKVHGSDRNGSSLTLLFLSSSLDQQSLSLSERPNNGLEKQVIILESEHVQPLTRLQKPTKRRTEDEQYQG